MALEVNDQNIGHATAYGYAKSKGFTGTEEEFAELMASYATVAESAKESALKSEGNAIGEQEGVPVEEGSPYYHNNAKYYSEQASGSATTASDKASEASGSADSAFGSASSASTNALKAEGYAVGKQNGSDVGSGSPYYHSNAKYYSEQAANDATQTGQDRTQTGLDRTQTGLDATAAAGSATAASASALKAEGYANGKQNGTPVGSGSPYYQNNAEYFSEQAGDSATAAANSAAEAEATLSEYCKASGTVDNALQLASNNGITDQVPYLFRPSKSGNREYDEIVGGTVVWNQIAPALTSADYSTNWSYSGTIKFSDGIATVTGTNGTDFHLNTFSAIANHRYLIVADAQTLDNVPTLKFRLGSSANSPDISMVANTRKTISAILSVASTQSRVFLISGDATTLTVYRFMVFDLTQMFGTTIADYIYTLESGTSGAGIAKLKEWGFFSKPYYAYSAGSLESVNVSSHNMVGFNQWDEQYLQGYYTSNGAFTSTDTQLCTKNKIKVVPSTTYYLKVGSLAEGVSIGGAVCFYDANENLISRESQRVGTFTTPSNCYFIHVNFGSSYGGVYYDDICINISSDRNGEYEPYIKHSYPLDSSLTLRGIWKLDANNKPYCDGDRYLPDGTVERRYGIVDLGSLTYIYESNNLRFFSTELASLIRKPSANTVAANVVCSLYTTKRLDDVKGDINDMCVGVSASSGSVFFTNTAYTDRDVFKAAMSGIYLVYELATPTTESADPYQTPQIVDEYGTEEYIDYAESQGTRDVAVPVGHSTRYPTNQVKKLDGLPSDFSTLIAPTEAQMNATRNYVVNDFLIVSNQLYKVTQNIASGGTITVGTNVTATTLGAQITGLLNS